jgi:TPR repeat protein
MSFISSLFVTLLFIPISIHTDQLSDGKAAFERHDWQTALKLLQPLAEKGNADAEVEIGQLYLSGEGVEYNRQAATEWFYKAAQQGNAEGQYWMGFLYETSPPDWKKDYSAVMVDWYRKAVDQGNVNAEMHLANYYEHGGRGGANQNYTEALKLYRNAAEKDNIEAQYSLGRFYHDGTGVMQNYKVAGIWYRKAADAGYPLARLGLAQMYSRGEGVKQDAAESAKWRNPPKLPEDVVKALDNVSMVTLYSIQPLGGPDLPEWDFHGQHQLGHSGLDPDQARQAIAALKETVSDGTSDMMSMCMFSPRHALRITSNGDMYDILICYQCGQLALYKNDKPLDFSGSIGQNPDALNHLLKQAAVPLADDPSALQNSYAEETKTALQKAQRGDKKAEALIGKYLIMGRGMKKDNDQGIDWLAKAYGTSRDNPDFEIRLGKMLEHSQDSTSNAAEIKMLFQAAANKGNAEGQYQLGYLYQVYGKGEGDQIEALKWLRMAADKDNPKAQYELGIFYAQGEIVKQDYAEAMKWFRKAAGQGHPEAMHWIASMYEKGWGVEKDLGEAYFWYQLSHEYYTIYGNQPFYITPGQKAAAEKRATEWKLTHPRCPDNCHS